MAAIPADGNATLIVGQGFAAKGTPYPVHNLLGEVLCGDTANVVRAKNTGV